MVLEEAALALQLSKVSEGARRLRQASTAERNQILLQFAKWLRQHKSDLLGANQKDIGQVGRDPQCTEAFKDRLLLTEQRIENMLDSLAQIAYAPDPVGAIVEKRSLPNGLEVSRVRAPLGVIYMIFESRPNVAVEAAALALKSANGIILRGGKESLQTVTTIYQGLQEVLGQCGFSDSPFWGVEDPSRELSLRLLKQKKWIDVVVPRGGDGLIEFVTQNSLIPLIKNDRGLCHVYVHQDADLEMAVKIIENAKTQRPGVCNAMETLLVDRAIAPTFLPEIFKKLANHAVTWWACPESRRILLAAGAGDMCQAADPDTFDQEYLDLQLSCRVVDGPAMAAAHIASHGSKHSEVIVTKSTIVAEDFLANIDAAAVYWNASSRFTDGMCLGLGGELGISTQKLHVRGPVGLAELTTPRWVIRGKGQIRE